MSCTALSCNETGKGAIQSWGWWSATSDSSDIAEIWGLFESICKILARPPTHQDLLFTTTWVLERRVQLRLTSTYQGSRLCHGTAGCLLQDWSPVTAYLSHLSAWCVGVRGPAAVASTYKVWRVAPSARVSGPALRLLRVSFRGALSPISAAFVTTSAAWLTLSVTLVVLWIVSTTGRAPSSGIAPVAVPVSGVLTSLDCNASWAGDICRLCSLCTVAFFKEM